MPPDIFVKRLDVPLENGARLEIPYWELDSGAAGPRLLALTNQHGNEVSGCEAVRRFVEDARPQIACGIVQAIPFANRPALHHRRPHYNLRPEQPYTEHGGHNLGEAWPGDPGGNDAQRIAAAVWQRLGKNATHIVDIHCHPRCNTPMSQIPGNVEASRRLARVSGIPMVILLGEPRKWRRSIIGCATSSGIVAMGIELRGQYRVFAREVERGRRALLNVAGELGIVESPPETRGPPPAFFSDTVQAVSVFAERDGLFVPAGPKPGDLVERGQTLGHLLSDETLGREEIAAPAGGLLRFCGGWRKDGDVSLAQQHPYVFAGDRLAAVMDMAHREADA